MPERSSRKPPPPGFDKFQLNLFAGQSRRRGSHPCVYCGTPSDTKDHVPPKCFLVKPYPPKLNLPTLPSCRKCNGSLGRDQEYFLAVLAQISEAPSLTKELEEGGKLDAMLTRNHGLADRITKQLYADEHGGVSIAPEMGRVTRVLTSLATGLYYKRYGVVADPTSMRLIAAGPEQLVLGGLVGVLYSERFVAKRWLCLQKDVFEYILARAWWQKSLACIMRLHSTLIAAVECPYPPRRKSIVREAPTKHPRMAGPWPGLSQ